MAKPPTTRATRRSAWRGIRPRLVAVLLIPTLAAVGLGGLRVAAAVNDRSAATRAATIASALPDSFRLALQLQVERDTLTEPRVTAKDRARVESATNASIAAWRARRAEMDISHDPRLSQDLATIGGSLNGIAKLRADAITPGTRLLASTEYTNTLNTLLGLAARLPDLGSAHDLYRQASALGEVRTAAEALADQRTLVTKALTDNDLSQYDLTALATATESWHAASDFFYRNTSPRAQKEFDTINGGSGDLLGSHAPMQAAVSSLLSTGDTDAVNMNLSTWSAASGDFLAQVAGVIATAAADLAAAVEARKAAAERDAAISGVSVALIFLLVLLASVFLARSILGPLNRLRDAALDIARRGLPERVRALEASDRVGDLSVEPIVVGSRDEIAEVATAFDAVHAEAIRLAGEQAQMRANVNKMFVNLSRRSQSLVERQLRLIDQLESDEQDPDHLANLFRLDHLATRMRRNDESLMVLAGGDTGQAARGPVPVLDVLRAASSEVEQFARIEIESGETAKFRGGVAGDLVHLLAELIENATNFSPPDTTVVVRSSRTSPVGPLVIEVRDLGIGMTAGELDAANEKLRSAGDLDADVARMMGLVVTARLASRHALTVELRANSPRGVVARVEVPAAALLEPETRSALLLDAVDLAGPLLESPAPREPLQRSDRSVSPIGERELAPKTAPASKPDVSAEPVAAVESVAPVEPVASVEVLEPAERTVENLGRPALPRRPTASTPVPPSSQALPGAPMPASVRPPEGYQPPADRPVASEPPVQSWFTSTVPLRDPEELLNNYLIGRAEGVDGAIKNPFAGLTKRGASGVGGSTVGGAAPHDGEHQRSSPGPLDAAANGALSPVDRAGLTGSAPEPATEPTLTSSGLPTRVPRSSLPPERPFDAFGAAPAPAADAAPATEPLAEPLPASSAASVAESPAESLAESLTEASVDRSASSTEPLMDSPAEQAEGRGPVLDPLIAELAVDVLSAPSAEEALAESDGREEDDTSIFASLQSEWFTRRTSLEARRSQPDPDAQDLDAESADWVSPGDEGWRRAAEVADPVAEDPKAETTADGLPLRVPGRNLVPGSAEPVIPAAAAENVVPMPRLERRRTRGLSSFQQGVSRARTSEAPGSEGVSEEITVPGAYDASANRAMEEQQ
ncbi:hypothetical protein JCM18899A_15720 [Nocardioides sp. AN3]